MDLQKQTKTKLLDMIKHHPNFNILKKYRKKNIIELIHKLQLNNNFILKKDEAISDEKLVSIFCNYI